MSHVGFCVANSNWFDHRVGWSRVFGVWWWCNYLSTKGEACAVRHFLFWYVSFFCCNLCLCKWILRLTNLL